MASKRKAKMFKEELKDILKESMDTMHSHYNIELDRTLLYIPRAAKLSMEQLRKMVELAKKNKTEIFIGDEGKIIKINKFGKMEDQEIKNAKSFMKNLIITQKLRERFEKEEEKPSKPLKK